VGIEAEVHVHGDATWAGVYHTGDLSTSGAFLVSDDPPPRGSMVRLDLRMEGDVEVNGVQALVVHVRSDASVPSARGCGVMFLRMGKDDAETLGSYVDSRADAPE